MKNVWNKLEIRIKNLIKALYSSFGKECSEEKLYIIMQFIKFCVVGVSNAVVYYIVYAGSLLLFRHYGFMHEIDYQISQVLGFLLSVFWAFNLNKIFVFSKSDSRYIYALIKFYATYSITGLLMNSVLLYFWKNIGVSDYIGPFINILFTTPVNYIMSKIWAFKRCAP